MTKQIKEQQSIKMFSKATTFVRPMLGYPVAFFGKKFNNCHISMDPELIHVVLNEPLEDTHSEYFGILDTLRNDPNYISEDE